MSKLADVLFVCVHNAGRSQIARTLFNAKAKEAGLDLTADSAGTIPSGRVHPEVVDAMRELGFDLSHERGKLLIDEMLMHRPTVITMGCQVDAEACPSLVLEEVVDWGLPDPKGEPLETVRKIRDEIAARVDSLLLKLQADSKPAGN